MNRSTAEAAIPPSTLETIRAWIDTARPTGHFVDAVLSNDLSAAFGRADEFNRAAMYAIVFWLHNYAPSGCWGSREQVNSWAEYKREVAA